MKNYGDHSEQASKQDTSCPEGNFVIVIGRQFGSGGRTIGKMVASKLGIAYYDTELLDKAAREEGIDPNVFKYHEEKKPSLLKVLLQGLYGIADNFHIVPLSSERIYKLQSKIIREFCSKGSCVIVGRNADFILRDHPRLLSVFLHAPLETRVKRIIERQDALKEDEARELALRHDKRREAFYNFYTGENRWGVASNYHLTFDTSRTDFENVTNLIVNTLKTIKN